MSELALFGHDLFGEAIKPKATGPVAERFTFPPFTILDARGGEWQDRKLAWASMGIKGEVGRDAASIHCPTQANGGGLRMQILQASLIRSSANSLTAGGAPEVGKWLTRSLAGVFAGLSLDPLGGTIGAAT